MARGAVEGLSAATPRRTTASHSGQHQLSSRDFGLVGLGQEEPSILEPGARQADLQVVGVAGLRSVALAMDPGATDRFDRVRPPRRHPVRAEPRSSGIIVAERRPPPCCLRTEFRAIPVRFLQERFLDPLGLAQVALAEHLGVPVQRINEIVRGKGGVTPQTALLLAQALGTTPEYWISLQANHDLVVDRTEMA